MRRKPPLLGILATLGATETPNSAPWIGDSAPKGAAEARRNRQVLGRKGPSRARLRDLRVGYVGLTESKIETTI